jgi:hypothetical protein
MRRSTTGIRQHTSVYVSVCLLPARWSGRRECACGGQLPAYVSIRQHTSAYACYLRDGLGAENVHAEVNYRHTSAYVSIRQRMLATCAMVWAPRPSGWRMCMRRSTTDIDPPRRWHRSAICGITCMCVCVCACVCVCVCVY